MSAYELRDLTFHFGDRMVLCVESLRIPGGGMTALVGPNGSGKTTLLHLLAFLTAPTAGELLFFGEPAREADRTALRRRVGIVLQNPYLFRRSVQSNVEWALRLRDLTARECRERLERALEVTGLQDLRHRPAHRLSGGEAQRVALARVLALEPEVLLLDEPTSHVDVANRRRVERTVADWNASRGTTVVLATHDMDQAYRLGAGILHMEDGRIEAFAGDNVFKGSLSPHTPGLFDTGRVRIWIYPPPAEATMVRISPTEIVLSLEDVDSSARNCLRGKITSVEPAGGGVLRALVDAGEPLQVMVTDLSWREMGLSVGTEVVASFKATAVHVC